VFFYSFFTEVISTSILSHTILFHLFISAHVVKLFAGTIFVTYLVHLVHTVCVKNQLKKYYPFGDVVGRETAFIRVPAFRNLV